MNIYKRNSIRVPVKLVDGRWEFFYGGQLPIKRGTVGDLLVDKIAIEDKEFLASLKRKSAHKLFKQGTELLVALTIKSRSDLDAELANHLMKAHENKIALADSYYHTLRSNETQFVKISIDAPTPRQLNLDPAENGGVWLLLEGLEPKGLTTSTVKLPDGVSDEPAVSLNHAFTLLSEKYEPWRKAHTGNIYDRILYQEENNKWYPLDVLRNATIAEDEHKFIRAQWAEISKKLKFNPK